jgi:hypothetical protein
MDSEPTKDGLPGDLRGNTSRCRSVQDEALNYASASTAACLALHFLKAKTGKSDVYTNRS